MRVPSRPFTLALLTGFAAVAAAPAFATATPQITLVACAPGFPGSTAEAQPAMDALAVALSRAAALPAGTLGAVYLPSDAEGVARLGQADAAVALLSLPFFLEHAALLQLEPRLQVEVVGSGALERWSLVARKGRVSKPSDLAGLTLFSTAGYAPSFVRGALGAWGRIPDSAKVSQTSLVLSALRKAAAGAEVALLLDGAQTEALGSLPFAADLELVARSAPVPTSVVVTVGRRISAARWGALEKGLLGLASDASGAAALSGVRMARFAPLDLAALATARALGSGGSR